MQIWCSEIHSFLGVMLQAVRVGQKRSRDSDADELEFYDDGSARKKGRIGWPAQQWITIYNKHVPMKQRCHPLSEDSIPEGA